MKAWIASRRRLRSGSTTWSWMASNPGGTRSGVFVDHYPVLAIRKLAVEATDNGLLAPELAAGIARVKKASGCARETGCRSNRRRQLPNAPDITTTKALRDRAIIAVLLNGLLAPELAAGIARVKSAKSIGVRSGHWLTLRQPQAPPERAEHHDQRGCATAPSSPCYSAVRCADLRWLRLRWGTRPAAGWPVVHRGSPRQARACAPRTAAAAAVVSRGLWLRGSIARLARKRNLQAPPWVSHYVRWKSSIIHPHVGHPHAGGGGDGQRAAGAGTGRRHQAARSASRSPRPRAAPDLKWRSRWATSSGGMAGSASWICSGKHGRVRGRRVTRGLPLR